MNVHLTATVYANYDAASGYWTLYDGFGMHSIDHWRSEPEARSAFAAHEVAWEYITGRSA